MVRGHSLSSVSPQCAVGTGCIRRSTSVDFSELRHQKVRAQCVLCLGRACRRCGELAWIRQGGSGAIAGLHSNWIFDRVLAMQRPSSRAIAKHGILDSFDRCGIGAVFNLQEPGEHAACGNGILQEGGFSYAPQELMARGVRFYLFSWRDLKTPTSGTMLNCVKVMAGELERGAAIAVHCHAGLGRTGVAIACLLVYLVAADPTAAIALIRQRRPGSVQKRKQELFIERFAARIAALRTVTPTAAAEGGALTLDEVLERQYELLHGVHAQRLRTVPQVVLACCTRLETLAAGAAAEEVGLALAGAVELAPVGDAAAEAAAGSARSEALATDAAAEASGIASAHITVPGALTDEGSTARSAPSLLRASLDASHDGLHRLRDEAAASAAATVLVEWLEALRSPVLPRGVRECLAVQTAAPLLGVEGAERGADVVAVLPLSALLGAALPSAGAASTTARVARMLRRVRERGCPAVAFDVACARVGAALCGGDGGGDRGSSAGVLMAALAERADSGVAEPELSPLPHVASPWAQRVLAAAI